MPFLALSQNQGTFSSNDDGLGWELSWFPPPSLHALHVHAMHAKRHKGLSLTVDRHPVYLGLLREILCKAFKDPTFEGGSC